MDPPPCTLPSYSPFLPIQLHFLSVFQEKANRLLRNHIKNEQTKKLTH